MAADYFCSECGEAHSSINVVEVLTSAGPADRLICDECLDSLTGTVIGPCATCGDLYARHTRRTETDSWTCEGCACGRPLASAA